MTAEGARADDLELRLRAAEEFINSRHADEALELLERTVSVAPTPRSIALAWSLKSRALLELGRPDEALPAAEVAIAADPNSAYAHGQLGYVFDAMGRYDEALSAAESALHVVAHDPYAWSLKAHALTQLGRQQEALEAVDQALELAPTDGPTWSTKGLVLFRLGRYEEAVASYDKALLSDQRYPYDHVSLLESKARTLGVAERYEEAVATANRALELDRSSVAALEIAGVGLLHLERFEEALSRLERYTNLRPSSVVGWYSLGLARQHLGLLGDALLAYDRALELQPEHDRARTGRNQVLARLYIEGRLPTTIDLTVEPGLRSVHVWLSTADLYQRLKRNDEALAAFDQAMVCAPDDPTPALRKYMFLRDRWRVLQALAAFREYARRFWRQALRERAASEAQPPG